LNFKANMPQLETISSTRSNLYLWNITESLAVLKNLYQQDLPEKFSKIKTEIHQKQFIVQQILLRKLQLQNQLTYLPNGKPVLPQQYISISHAQEYVAIAVSNEPLGVDIEAPNPKLLKIAPRFVSSVEVHLLADFSVQNLQKLWTAKESIYKLMNRPGLNFKNQILVNWNTGNINEAKAVAAKTKINLYYEYLIDDFVICQAFFDK